MKIQSIKDSVTLNCGVEMPCLAYGTWQSPVGELTRDGVKTALEVGYRSIDTASGYGNEESVGEGIRASGVARSEIFLTTKHWIMDRGYTKTIAAVESSLARLGTDYIDLYLVHWPCTPVSSPKWAEINAATWRGFEKMVRDGKIRAIGVSNYLPEHILELEKTAEIKPAVNQIEFHPGYHQPELVRWSQAHGMAVEAWSALGCGAVLSDPLVCAIAEKHGRSSAQVCLRFALQYGVCPITKSVHADRIRANADLYDFSLDEEDMMKLSMMYPLGYSTYHPAQAPADTLFGGNYDVD
jgi:diketogulonate reductase-like aldo/keto reductase